MSPPLVRPPTEPPARSALPAANDRIHLHHPAHAPPHDYLLTLMKTDPVADPATGAVAGWGLHAQFALDACGVIAGNRFDGWLAESRDSTAAGVEPDSILQGEVYYFHLPGAAPYGVVPSFRDWQFPHGNLPRAWQRLATSSAPPRRTYTSSSAQLRLALRARDGPACALSGCEDGAEAAHLCPRAEASWWRDNGMTVRYKTGRGRIDDLANAVLLRSDLRDALDDAAFVFAPKPDAEGVQRLVVHVLGPSASPQMHALYHNRQLRAAMRACVPAAFARFAWTVFGEFGTPRGHFERVVPRERGARARSGSGCAKRRKIGSGAAAGAAAPSEAGRSAAGTSDAVTGAAPSAAGTASAAPSDAGLSSAGPSAAGSYDTAPGAAPSAASPSASAPSADPGSDQESVDDLPPVARDWLARERQRSDPEGRWAKEKAWAKKVSRGDVTMDGKAARRWYEISGVEVFDVDEAGSPFREGVGSPPRGEDGSPLREEVGDEDGRVL